MGTSITKSARSHLGSVTRGPLRQSEEGLRREPFIVVLNLTEDFSMRTVTEDPSVKE